MVAFVAFGFAACNKTTTTVDTTATTTTEEATTTEPATTADTNVAPVLTGVDNTVVGLSSEGGTFNPLSGVSAYDEEDGDLTASVTYTGTVDLTVAGESTLTYSVTDSNGVTTTAQRTVTVAALVYAQGFYNYKFATTELRHTFMAAAEDYLLHNMDGGIPLFDSGSYVMYDSRVSLPVSAYVPVMGYGASFGTMTADDSTVEMNDGQVGDAGVYTYRTTISENPGTWNQWLYDTSTDSTLMGLYYGALYTYHFNADKTGYEVVSSMASGDPVAIDSRTTDTGKVVSYTWRISIRDDLEWYFHPNTDSTFLATNPDLTIDANDFIDTFQLALEEGWFRAVSGGGDFVTSAQEIVGASDFYDAEQASAGSGDWDSVGLKVIDDNTIEFTFVDEQSDWNVRYWLSSFVMTPINLELYDYLLNDGDDDTNYGTSEDTIGYTGPYYVDYFESGVVIEYAVNPSYYDPNEYFYDGYLMYVEEDPDIIWALFEEGLLDVAAIPTAKYTEYKNFPGVLAVPGATIYRMMINGLGTVEAQQELFPDSTWVPEPILANQDFKMAMFFAIDREYLATVVMKTRAPSIYLFSTAYLVDAELGVAYRDTVQGESVATDLAPDTYGFNFDAAQAYYESALDTLVAAGVYADGTAANPTIITIEFNVFSGSESQAAMGDYIEYAFEAAFQSTNHYINVDLEWYPKDFPSIYYDYMMTGDFDLSIGGISGSTLDAASFLDVFSSDNRSGFTLNWGIDTSVADIPMYYIDSAGVAHAELWSYDAIVSALNGEIFLVDGEEADVPAGVLQSVTANSFTFKIKEFANQAYTNITYTVQYYDYASDAYYDLAGYVDLVPASDTVTVTGMTPYFYWYGPTGSIVYRGDYQVVVSYTYVVDSTKTGSTTMNWFTTDTALVESTTNGAASNYTATPTSAVANVEFNAGYTAADVASVAVIDTYTWTDVTSSVTLDASNLAAVTVSGLDASTRYFLLITFTDGNWDAFRFYTADPAEATVTATDTTATLAMVYNSDDGVTRTVTAATVYLASDDSAVSGAAVDFATDPANIAVTGLAASTDYYVELTFSDGSVLYVDITTTAAPSA